jgi:diguanylate cyclase (GGDEF)-like protein
VRQSILDGELRSMALTDQLTGLHNRRGFAVLAEQQLKLAIRNMQGVLLFFCDIDNLKEINDAYGHEEGDCAMGRAAHALKETFRDSDILARLGGDEFGVLAFEAASESQEGILRRLGSNIKRVAAGESRYELSLSIGVSRFDPENPLALAELISGADRAMYHEKRRYSKGTVSGAIPGNLSGSGIR